MIKTHLWTLKLVCFLNTGGGGFGQQQRSSFGGSGQWNRSTYHNNQV